MCQSHPGLKTAEREAEVRLWVAAGRASIAADWFGKLGYELPRGVNQADFFLDIASGEISTYKINGEDARLHCIACAEKFMEDNPDGFTEGAVLKESDLGAHLWNAAEVRPARGLDAAQNRCMCKNLPC